MRETRAHVLAFPGLIAVVVIATVIRQLFVHAPSASIFGGCAALAVFDVFLALFLLRMGRATFVVTESDITFTPRAGAGGKSPSPQDIRRGGGSALSFRLQENGIIGGRAQYLLMLRDDATGREIAATSFGRRRVRRACQSQGWPFS